MKRTWNMPIIVVTLDVSKLSGWLKADAPCRVEEGRTMRHERSGPGGTREAGQGVGWRHARGRPE